jgi:ABC-2 type transport system ATP-binding protein
VVAILREGRLIEQERVEVLRKRAVRHVELVFESGSQPADPPPEGLTVLQQTGPRLSATWTGPADPLLSWLAQAGVRDVTIAPPDLEDLFLAYYPDNPEEAQT